MLTRKSPFIVGLNLFIAASRHFFILHPAHPVIPRTNKALHLRDLMGEKPEHPSCEKAQKKVKTFTTFTIFPGAGDNQFGLVMNGTAPYLANQTRSRLNGPRDLATIARINQPPNAATPPVSRLPFNRLQDLF